VNLSRRDLLKVVGSTGLAMATLGFDAKKVKAATADFKLTGATEYTSICTFCSCGCGMLCHVKDGKLINLEGDPDHIINEGALCSKGISMSVIPNSDQRMQTPLYRAPGSDKWEKISWEDAVNRIATKMKDLRDKHWIDTEVIDGKEYKANRTDAISFMGGAQNTNEECYMMSKMMRLIGTDYVEHQARL
jgi:formate dehydrogenase major subunit